MKRLSVFLCVIALVLGMTSAANAIMPVPEAPIPEPSTLLLLGTGLVGLVGLRKKFRK